MYSPHQQSGLYFGEELESNGKWFTTVTERDLIKTCGEKHCVQKLTKQILKHMIEREKHKRTVRKSGFRRNIRTMFCLRKVDLH